MKATLMKARPPHRFDAVVDVAAARNVLSHRRAAARTTPLRIAPTARFSSRTD